MTRGNSRLVKEYILSTLGTTFLFETPQILQKVGALDHFPVIRQRHHHHHLLSLTVLVTLLARKLTTDRNLRKVSRQLIDRQELCQVLVEVLINSH